MIEILVDHRPQCLLDVAEFLLFVRACRVGTPRLAADVLPVAVAVCGDFLSFQTFGIFLMFLNRAQRVSRRRLWEKYGDFQAGIANTDLPAVHRGEPSRRLAYSWLLRVDGLRPEPPVAASMEGAAVVRDWFRDVLLDAALPFF